MTENLELGIPLTFEAFDDWHLTALEVGSPVTQRSRSECVACEV